MDTLSIVKRIDLRLVELGISKSEFYKRSGISSASYSQWNTGKYNPSPDKLRKASDFLGVSYDYLVNGTPAETKKEPLAVNGEKLSDAEVDLISLFRKVPEDQKQLVLQMIRVALGNRK